MDTNQKIEVFQYLSTLLVSLGGFGILYRIMKEKSSIYTERIIHLEKQIDEFEKIKNSEVLLWQTKFENITKEVDSNIRNEIAGNKIQIEHPFSVLSDENTVGFFEKYNIAFEQIDSKVLEQHEFSPETLLLIHMYYYGLKDYSQSLIYINKAIELKPDNSYFYSYKAGALKKVGKLNEALNECEKALLLENLNADAYYNRATIFAMQNKKEEAVMDLMEAIKIKGEYLSHAKNTTYFNGYDLKI